MGIIECCMRLPYGPTLFRISTIAAEQFLALAHVMKLLPLADSFELANFIKDIWFELAHQAHNEVLHETAVWATFFGVSRIAAKQLLALAHIMKLLPLADSFELANLIKDIWFEWAHQAHNEVLYETAVWAHIL